MSVRLFSPRVNLFEFPKYLWISYLKLYLLTVVIFPFLQAWEMYNSESLLQLVDPVLNHNFNKEEATRYLKIGLLCVQERASMRPQMSTIVKMLTNEITSEEIKITKPGQVENIMDIKIGKKTDSHTFTSSKASTSSTFVSNRSTYFWLDLKLKGIRLLNLLHFSS